MDRQPPLPDRETLLGLVFENFGENHLEDLILTLIYRRIFAQLDVETKQVLILGLLDLNAEVVIPASNQVYAAGQLLDDPLRILYTRYLAIFRSPVNELSDSSEPER